MSGLTEHDSVPWEALPGQMEQVGNGEWRLADRPVATSPQLYPAGGQTGPAWAGTGRERLEVRCFLAAICLLPNRFLPFGLARSVLQPPPRKDGYVLQTRSRTEPARSSPTTSPRRGGLVVLAAGTAALVTALVLYLANLLSHPLRDMLTWLDLRLYVAAGHVARHARPSCYVWPMMPGFQFTYTPFAALVFAGAWASVLGGTLTWLMTAASVPALGLAVWLTLGALGWRRQAPPRRRVAVSRCRVLDRAGAAHPAPGPDRSAADGTGDRGICARPTGGGGRAPGSAWRPGSSWSR